MPTSKRPEKIKFDIVKPPTTLSFSENIVGRRGISIYVVKLQECLNTSSALRILLKDGYLRTQLKLAAKKLKVKLVYGVEGEYLYIKPVEISDEQKRLLLYLREPRTESELQSKKLELHLTNTLEKFRREGIAHICKDKWVLTEKGFDTL